MILREYLPSIDHSLCRRCRKCEEICPAAAVSLVQEEKRMAVDPGRCIDCQRCMDACPENAITMLPRKADRVLRIDLSCLDPWEIKRLCRRVGLAPGEAVCACSFITARELAGAVLLGARTPEDVCAMTGVRRGCGIYCLVNVFKILEAGGVTPEERRKSRLYHHPLDPLDIPEERLREIDARFPQFRILDDVSLIRKFRGRDMLEEA
ncbi:4Fe-4S dicluster domain-containing protein [Candidatus Solincola tengchongensis]|uniref:4Fe-4S dicluster domain-containing protein n=1 Tax=Candidatus Solincola tengchongensis TaxID=2900693 RepID=UPI00257BAD9B